MTPLELQFLIHCYCIREPYPRSSSAIEAAIRHFLNADLIIETMAQGTMEPEVFYKTTLRGTAMVVMLMNTPLPEKAWIDTRTNKIIEED